MPPTSYSRLETDNAGALIYRVHTEVSTNDPSAAYAKGAIGSLNLNVPLPL